MFPSLGFIEDTYSVMYFLGVIAALVLFEIYLRKHHKVKSKDIYYLEMSLIIAVLLGIVLSYSLQNLYNFIDDPEHFEWRWTSTFYGGIIGGGLGFFIPWFFWGRKHYPEGTKYALIIAPASIALAHGIGRIGCFFAGCCYGIETEAWYGIQFPGHDHKVIPTNLFEAIFLLILSAVLIYNAFKEDYKYNFPTYFIAYGLWRFIIEFVRDDYRGSFIPGITPSQFWSILLFLAGIIWVIVALIFEKKKKDNNPENNVENNAE